LLEQDRSLVTDQPQNIDRLGGVEVLAPKRQTAPVVFSSPHSGRVYTDDFVRQSRLDHRNLRRSEDAFIDEAFISAPEFGAPLLRAHFPRAYIDANRRPWELDPAMFSETLPDYVTTRSPRIAAGLGTVPKIVASGEPIYRDKLDFDDARHRMENHYLPYHQTLEGLILETLETFGGCLLVDCHSMPSAENMKGPKLADVIIGDCHGKSCSRDVIDLAISSFREFGYSVALNKPYAGGYTTRHYGRPANGIHALQIEISRGLYMDEKHIERGPGLSELVRHMRRLIHRLTAIDIQILAAPGTSFQRAAE
jgi:N-formylglutamate amidohydrolase